MDFICRCLSRKMSPLTSCQSPVPRMTRIRGLAIGRGRGRRWSNAGLRTTYFARMHGAHDGVHPLERPPSVWGLPPSIRPFASKDTRRNTIQIFLLINGLVSDVAIRWTPSIASWELAWRHTWRSWVSVQCLLWAFFLSLRDFTLSSKVHCK